MNNEQSACVRAPRWSGEISRPIVSDDPVCDPNPRVMEMCAPADKALKHGGFSTNGRPAGPPEDALMVLTYDDDWPTQGYAK